MDSIPDQNLEPSAYEPCYCDLQAVIDEVAKTMDDAMYSHGLEWDCSVNKAASCLREYVRTVVDIPTRACEECRREP